MIYDHASAETLTDELYACVQSPACGDQVINKHHPLPRLHSPFVHLNFVGAVLRCVLLRYLRSCTGEVGLVVECLPNWQSHCFLWLLGEQRLS